MNKKNALRNYLIKHFLLILILVGIAESGLNLLYHNLVYPWLSETFGVDRIFTDTSLIGAITTLGSSFFWMCLGSLAGLLPGGIGSFFKNSAKIHAENLLREELLFCIFLILLLVWLLPYLIASISFGFLVSKRAALLEAEKNEQQRSYERQRNLLLSDVAHDLKTPMTTVAGYASALATGAVNEPEKQQEYLDSIYRKSMQMNELVHLLFEYVKLDSEGFALKKENLDLSELLRECIANLYSDFEKKDMTLALDIPDESIPASIDRLQFERAIHNLLVNAAKHNPSGTKVYVALRRRGTNLVISIQDNGVLIPEDTAAHLFEPFVQGDASRSGRRGSGLGLSITEKVISMHGGTIILNQDETAEYTKSFIITLKDTLSEY